MKKTLIFAAVALLTTTNLCLAQSGKKAMVPVFVVSKAEILCHAGTFRDARKKVHIVSNAGWSAFTNIGLKITDANGATIATYTAIPGDFYTPPLALTAGQTYTISILNGDGTVMNPYVPDNPNPYLRAAPACGVEKPAEPKKMAPIKAF